MGVSTFSYHNASWSGDPRWASASWWTKMAPYLVMVIFVLSVLDTVLGAIWISKLASDMTIPKIIQPLIMPGLSFFNALPSIHLHLLTRHNPPMLAIWFSTMFAVLWFATSIVWLVSCNLPTSQTPLELRKIECSTSAIGVKHGPNEGIWWVVVVFGIFFVFLYGLHAAMAWKVHKNEKKKRAAEIERGHIRVTTQDDRQKARERWTELARYGEF